MNLLDCLDDTYNLSLILSDDNKNYLLCTPKEKKTAPLAIAPYFSPF